jgi:hypothetical protein
MNINELLNQFARINQNTCKKEGLETNTQLFYYRLVKGLIAPQSTSPQPVQ